MEKTSGNECLTKYSQNMKTEKPSCLTKCYQNIKTETDLSWSLSLSVAKRQRRKANGWNGVLGAILGQIWKMNFKSYFELC